MANPYDLQFNYIRSRIEHYANQYNVPVNVGIAQIWQESKFNPTVCSNANACGIAQFIPDTALRYGVNRNDVESSLNGWGRYMRDMLNMFNGRIDIALAGYNSGENRSEYRAAARENRAINWAIMPAGVKSQTQNYVKTIMAAAGASNSIPVSQVQPVVSSNAIEPNNVSTTNDILDLDTSDTVYIIAGLFLLAVLA